MHSAERSPQSRRRLGVLQQRTKGRRPASRMTRLIRRTNGRRKKEKGCFSWLSWRYLSFSPSLFYSFSILSLPLSRLPIPPFSPPSFHLPFPFSFPPSFVALLLVPPPVFRSLSLSLLRPLARAFSFPAVSSSLRSLAKQRNDRSRSCAATPTMSLLFSKRQPPPSAANLATTFNDDVRASPPPRSPALHL